MTKITIPYIINPSIFLCAHDQLGVDFINNFLLRIQLEADDHMPIGFEVVFPTLLEDAKELGLDLSCDPSIFTKITKERTKKLER